jgi:AcrR family transcriptional regulator
VSTTPVDRRRLRAERGRDAVVDALLELYAEGAVEPGAAVIAARAGVSERSVFRYFEDLEALAQAAIDRHWERVGPAFTPPPAAGTVTSRARALVEQRLEIHRVTGAVARVGAHLALRSESVARGIELRRRGLRDQIGALFPELDGRSDRAELLGALDAATSLEQVEYLRAAGLSVPRTRAVMLRTVLALLEPIDWP